MHNVNMHECKEVENMCGEITITHNGRYWVMNDVHADTPLLISYCPFCGEKL